MSEINGSSTPAPPGGPPTFKPLSTAKDKSGNLIDVKVDVKSEKGDMVALRELRFVPELSAVSMDAKVPVFTTMVSIKASELNAQQRPAADIVLVVDRSGSMRLTMDLVQNVMRYIVDRQLTSRDRLAIVSYAAEHTVDLPLVAMDRMGKDRAELCISKLRGEGGTNIAVALHHGLEILRTAFNPNKVQSVMLLTDGESNEGPAITQDHLVQVVINPNHYPSLLKPSILVKPQTVNTSLLSAVNGSSALSAVWEWSELDPNNKSATLVWTGYDALTTWQLEEELGKDAPMVKLDRGFFQSKDGYYVVLDEHFRQINLTTKYQRNIRRIVNRQFIQTSLSAVKSFNQTHPRDSTATAATAAGATVSSGNSLTGLFNRILGSFNNSNDAGFGTLVPASNTGFGTVIPATSKQPQSAASKQPQSAAVALASSGVAPMIDVKAVDPDSEGGKDVKTDLKSAVAPVPMVAPSVYTFGFMSNHDGACLKAIADAGNGTYSYISDAGQIGSTFAECLGGLLSVMMQRVQVVLTCPNPLVKIGQVRTHFPTVSNDGGKTVKIPDMQSEETRDILVEVNLPETAVPAVRYPLVNASVTFYNALTRQEEVAKVECTIVRCRSDEPILRLAVPNFAIDVQRNRLNAALAVKEAMAMADQHQYSAAKAHIDLALAKVKQSISAKDPFCVGVIQDLESALAAVVDDRSYTSGGTCTMSSISSSHQQQRSGHAYSSGARTKAATAYSLYTSSKPPTK